MNENVDSKISCIIEYVEMYWPFDKQKKNLFSSEIFFFLILESVACSDRNDFL